MVLYNSQLKYLKFLKYVWFNIVVKLLRKISFSFTVFAYKTNKTLMNKCDVQLHTFYFANIMNFKTLIITVVRFPF